jgi:hypothetical protein
VATTYEYIYNTIATAVATVTDFNTLPTIENDAAAFAGSKPNVVIMVGDEFWESALSESGGNHFARQRKARISFSIEIYANCAVKKDGSTVRAKIGEIGDKLRVAFRNIALPTTYNTSTIGATAIESKIIGVSLNKIYNAPMLKDSRVQALVTGDVHFVIK